MGNMQVSRYFLRHTSILRHRSPSILQLRKFCAEAATNTLKVEDITLRVINVAKSQERAKKDIEVNADTHLGHDLGLDSLDQVEFSLALEEEFSIEIPDEDAETINTVGAAIQFIQDNPNAK